MDMEGKMPRLGRLYIALCTASIVMQLVSLQLRHSIFGGTAWLVTVKYEGVWERLGIFMLVATFCAALCGLWLLLGDWLGRVLKFREERTHRWLATLWLVFLVLEMLLRLKLAEFLGSKFRLTEFASGVGGFWRMLVQAFNWYWDIILLSLFGVFLLALAIYFFNRWFLGQRFAIFRAIDRVPRKILILIASVSFCVSLTFMAFPMQFPLTRELIASETAVGAPFSYILKLVSDFDGDGYGRFDLPPDTAPLDPDCYPYALDIPNDGIDQDLLLGDLQPDTLDPALRAWIETQGQEALASPATRKNVFLVFMESVRNDMLDASIEGKRVMPELKAFRDKGALRIARMFATRGFTQNSITQSFWGSFFDPGTSLVDDFTQMGYKSVALSGESLLDEGFDVSLGWLRNEAMIVDPRHMPENERGSATVPARVVAKHFERILEEDDGDKPLFMYVFLQDPHFPYQQDNPPVLVDRTIMRSEINAKNRARLWRSYANQVHHLDAALGRMIAALEARNLLEDSLIIIVSDHGESLYDDGSLLGHGIALQNVMTHCAMLVWGASGSLEQNMSQIDLRRFILTQSTRQASEAPFTGVAERDAPLLQFIGATTVPSSISFLYPNDERIVYNYATNRAYRESSSASYPHQIKTAHLQNTERLQSPIPDALRDEDIQQLVNTWAYMQWFHRGTKN
ncbi:MAG: sulfatase-like hydrolase/transferase [Bradymonadales bacterium]|jgi:hypothetical protein